MDGHREDDLVALRRHLGEVDQQRLVVALALTGEVVAGVLDRAVRALELVVEHEVFVTQDPPAAAHQGAASRSKSAPVVERASQPSPTITWVRLGAALDRETFPPLASVTPMCCSLPESVLLCLSCASGAARKRCGAGRREPGRVRGPAHGTGTRR